MNLARALAERAAERPEAPALFFKGDVVPYGELDRRAAVAAAALRARGVHEGDRVALGLPNTPAYVAAYFGVLRLGAVAVPLNVLLAQPEVEERLRVSAPAAVVDEPLPVEGEPLPDIAERGEDDASALLFTSGTTGGPKGAVLTHGGIRAAGRYGVEALAFTGDDVVLGVAPFPHVLGQQMLVSSFLAGAALAVVQRFEPEQTLATMTSTRTTILPGVPTMCVALVQAARGAEALPPLRIAHIGGAPVPLDVAREFEETFGARVHEGYGLTEMSGLATVLAVGRPRKPASVGRPSSQTDVRVADADERGVGEVQFRGPSVIPGFWNDPEATAAAIDAEGWLSTGDLGYLDEDGDLFLVDRKKEMIIRGGYNVYPREVEEVLYAHPSVLEAAVLGVPHETLGEEVAAVVVARPGAAVTPDELQAWTKERVAAYKYPRHVVLVDDLPKSPTGKIHKRSIERSRLLDAGIGGSAPPAGVNEYQAS
jgi:long-chain acyl-CoA synthetase